MSQALASAPLARPQPVGDAPDILFVLRHYRWLIIIGSLLGLVVGMALYVSLRIARPQYKGYTQFLVQPPANMLNGMPGAMSSAVSPEETGRYIRLQMSLLTNDDFVENQLFKQSEIVGTQWFQTHRSDPKKALKNTLVITPVAGTDLFQATMIIPQRVEVAKILNAIASVYVKEVENQNIRTGEEGTSQLRNARQTQEGEATRKRQTVDEFKIKHDINTMASTQTISLTALGSLYGDLTRMQIDYVSMEKQVKSIMEETAKPDYKLPLALQQVVDGDPVVRSLDNERLALERQLDVTLKSYSADHPSVRNIRNQIEAVNKQLKEVRDDTTSKVKANQVANAQSELASRSERIAEVKRRYDTKQEEIRDLDRYLNKNKQFEDDARKSEDLLRDIDTRLQIETLKINVPVTRVRQWQKASEPGVDDMASPTMTAFFPTGFAAGLVLSFVLAYVLELTNTRVRTPRDITRTMQLPLLGFVPDQIDDDLLTGDLSTSIRTSPSSMIAESFRQIRGRISAHSETPLRSILVASISPGGGATTVASNLANGLALNGRRVLLVDANFYRPGISAIYPGLPAVGFSDVLTDPSKADGAIAINPDLPTLSIMGPGSKQASASAQLLDSNSCREVIERLKSKYDMVIFDGAPLSLVSDSLSLSAKVDGVIAVVRAGRITRGTVARVREQLRQVKAQLLGVVLNAAQTQSAGYFKENYQTFYRYAQANGHAQPTRQTAGQA